MSIGFRATEADEELIEAHKRPDEKTSDVLRRALRALDREEWREQAHADMVRIAESGEDLSDEPDDWGYDEDGRPVDLRDEERKVTGERGREGAGLFEERRRELAEILGWLSDSPSPGTALPAMDIAYPYVGVSSPLAIPDAISQLMRRSAITSLSGHATGRYAVDLRMPLQARGFAVPLAPLTSDVHRAVVKALREAHPREASPGRRPSRRLAQLAKAARRASGR